MKSLNKLLRRSIGCVLLLSGLSFSSQAALITQQVFIDITDAEAGNSFSVTAADSGLFGTIQYDSDKVFGSTVSAGDDPLFSFSFNLKGFAVTHLLDTFQALLSADLVSANPMSGISGLNSSLEFGVASFASITGNLIDVDDDNGFAFSGMLEFGPPRVASQVSEPSIAVLLLSGLLLMARRRG